MKKTPQWVEDLIDSAYRCVENSTLGMLNQAEYNPKEKWWEVKLCPAGFDQEGDEEACVFDLFNIDMLDLLELFEEVDSVYCDREIVRVDGVYLGHDVMLSVFFDPQSTQSRGMLRAGGGVRDYPHPVERADKPALRLVKRDPN